ncbi:hypothetical protein MD484_g8941, partial [Candolleomyces efflorescens]
MCPSCRTRYRAYGITKRRKWKAERQAFELEMGELRRVEEERRKASGLPLLADNPEELRAWELSILDEQIALPPQVLAALGEADGEGSSNTSTAATAPSILSLYQNDPNQPSNTVSPNDIIGPYATVIDNTPQLPARMCTVSHCHQILPGYYRFKRCEQHRLQNRHHSKLKRVREKEEKAIGPKEGAVVVEIPLGTAELRKNVGGDRLEVKAKRARKGTHCAMEGCGNALPEEKRWRHCEVCRLAERAKKKPRAAAAAAVQIEANAQPAVDALETVQVFTNTNNTNEDEENSGLAPAVSTDLDTSNSNPPINPQPQPHQQQQELHLVNITSTTFPHPSGPQLYRWTVDAAQISTSTSTSSISSTSSSSTSSSSSTGTSPTDLSQQQQQNQQPLTIKQYDPSADKEPVMRHTANYQPYVTVERFPFRDVGVGGGGASSSADTGASTTTNPSISTSASASNGESNSASARDALTAGLETTTLTFALGEDGALTGCCQYDEGVFRHYVGPPRKGGGSQVSPVVVAGAGEVERGSVESTPSTVGEAGQVPSEKGMEPLRETGVSTPELEKTSISGVKSKWGDAGTSASRQAPVKPSPPLPPPPPTTTTTHAPPPPQPPVYPYHPYYLLSPSQYAQYAAAAAAGAYSLVYPPLHPSGPVPLPVPGSVPESASTAPNAKVKGTKKKGKGAVSAPTMAVHPHTYTYPVHLPYPYSALVPGQAGAQAVYYPSVYHYPLGVGVGVSASAPPAIPVPVRTAAAAGSVSAPAGGGGVSTSASAPPQPKSQAQVEGKAEGEPTKERVHKKQREPRAVFNYYHHGYGTTDSPEVPVGVEPGKRKRRKIDPAWLEKMRLRAEEEKRVAAEAATGDAAGSTTGSGAAVEVASTHVISSSSSVDLVEPVSAISSAYASEAEVEQSLEHAQGVGRNDSGMLDNVMDEDDLHVEDTRASITEASSSRSRLSERERDYEHGSPEANNVESNLPCYNKTCRRRVVSTSTTGGSTFCERCKAKFKKHAEKNCVIMDPHADDDVEKGSPRQTDKDLPPDPRFEQRTERESRIIVEEPEDINAPSTGVPEPINTQFQEQVQELQRELSDFLAQHVAKTLNLQNSIHNEPLKLRKHSSGVMHGGDNCEYMLVSLARNSDEAEL